MPLTFSSNEGVSDLSHVWFRGQDGAKTVRCGYLTRRFRISPRKRGKSALWTMLRSIASMPMWFRLQRRTNMALTSCKRTAAL